MARTYDIHFQGMPTDQVQGSLIFTFGQARTLGVAGLQKLVNMFLKYLMTPVGSNPLDPSEGTLLPTLVGSNIAIEDARDILQTAVDKTARAIATWQNGLAVPDDELISSATVTDYIVVPELPGFSAQIYIKNVANEALTFILPTLTVRL